MTTGGTVAKGRFHRWRGARRSSEGEVHAHTGVMADFILGSQDGLVNVLGILLGLAAASQGGRLILTAGLAATFAESIAMGAVAYTSTLARRQQYLGEEAREKREMKEIPEAEREEVRQILREWGFEGPELENMVERIAQKPKAWLEFMMSHELRLAPVPRSQARRSALLVGTSAMAGSLVPLWPFAILPGVLPAVVVSLAASAIVLFFIGWYKAKSTVGRPSTSALQMVLIGMAAAVAGFVIGLLMGGSSG